MPLATSLWNTGRSAATMGCTPLALLVPRKVMQMNSAPMMLVMSFRFSLQQQDR
jgi:hypothetical protein